MAQEYLPAPSNVRLADLMKEHNISQPELAKESAAPRVRRTESHEQESGRENVHRIDQRAGCAAPNDHGRAVGGCHPGQRFGHGRSYAGSTGTAAERSAGNLAVCRRAGKRP